MELMEAHASIIKSNRERYDRLVNIIVDNLQDDKEKVENLKHLHELLEKTVKNELSINNAKELVRLIQDSNNNDDDDDEKDMEELKQEYERRKIEFNKEENLKRLVAEDIQVRKLEDLIKTIRGERDKNIGDDDEIVATQEELCLIDPISKKMMEDPVRHIPCGHVYDLASILAVMKQNKRKGFRCPSMGCHYRQPIQKSDLIEAKEYKREIQKRKLAAKA